jgi:hypothetical protein
MVKNPSNLLVALLSPNLIFLHPFCEAQKQKFTLVCKFLYTMLLLALYYVTSLRNPVCTLHPLIAPPRNISMISYKTSSLSHIFTVAAKLPSYMIQIPLIIPVDMLIADQALPNSLSTVYYLFS